MEDVSKKERSEESTEGRQRQRPGRYGESSGGGGGESPCIGVGV